MRVMRNPCRGRRGKMMVSNVSHSTNTIRTIPRMAFAAVMVNSVLCAEARAGFKLCARDAIYCALDAHACTIHRGERPQENRGPPAAVPVHPLRGQLP